MSGLVRVWLWPKHPSTHVYNLAVEGAMDEGEGYLRALGLASGVPRTSMKGPGSRSGGLLASHLPQVLKSADWKAG
eukprot:241688-Amphidinium_carterae.2